ncbi:MAG: hypothetical protein HN745_10085 [Deltaproteobacteria bacterium]|nr:hypothetical protein [Deltaproteobacteria bacterium]MBT7712062.1 hypothetical protein [Deltaproteobacteria bacterium]
METENLNEWLDVLRDTLEQDIALGNMLLNIVNMLLKRQKEAEQMVKQIIQKNLKEEGG